MGRSIRVRLAVGQAVVLAAVVGGYAGLLYHEVRRSRLAELDAQLDTAAAGLEATLRLFPQHELDRDGPPPDRPPKADRPPKGDRPPKKDRPPDDAPAGRERLLATLNPPGPRGYLDGYFTVWRADGTVLKAAGAAAPAVRPDVAPDRPLRRTRGPDRERVGLGPQATTILVGRPTGGLSNELAAFASLLVGSGLAALLLGVVASWVLSRRLLRPVAAIAATAERIAGDGPAERVDVAVLDRELVRLGQVLNAAFDRLADAADRQGRFTADASHELRTPLAVVRAKAELALRRDRTPAEYQAALTAILGAAERMSRLVDRLLLLARADAAPPARTPVRLDELAREAVALLAPLAADGGVSLTADLPEVLVPGDPGGLAAAVENLVANAVRYNRPGGTVRVSLTAAGGTAVLGVADTGPGIPAAARPHLFERFYRADGARDRSRGGAGLGLAIVKAVVQAHGGAVTFDTSPQGTTFTVTLPGDQ